MLPLNELRDREGLPAVLNVKVLRVERVFGPGNVLRFVFLEQYLKRIEAGKELFAEDSLATIISCSKPFMYIRIHELLHQCRALLRKRRGILNARAVVRGEDFASEPKRILVRERS